MKRFLSLLLLLLLASAGDAGPINLNGARLLGYQFPSASSQALLLPSNVSGSDQGAPFVAIQFEDPQANGLPIWGPADAGVTYIWRYKPAQQTGYYALFWWSNNGSFLWDGGSQDTYIGSHPYPQNQSNTGTTHYWEIAQDGGDMTTTRSGSPKAVVKDAWYTQALRVFVNGDGSKTAIFYTALPSTANADVIEVTMSSGYGETDPPDPALTIGDSPWFGSFQHERASGALSHFEIFAAALSEVNMLAEANALTSGSGLATAPGIASIWWRKQGFDSVDDLADDSGSGRTFVWADPSNKGTLVSAQ